jgi:hypothetical protein
MSTNAAPPVLSACRRKNSGPVTSQVRLRRYTNGRVVIDGFGMNPAELAEMAARIETAPIADPAGFLAAKAERIYQAWTPARAMWVAYLAWAAEGELRTFGRHAFRQALIAAGLRYSRSRRDANAKQIRTWEGARLRVDGAAQLPEAES